MGIVGGGDELACCVLLVEEAFAGFAVDGAVEGGDDRLSVLGDDEGGAGGEFAELFGADDGGVFAVGGDRAMAAVLLVAACDAPSAEEVADLAG
ncbi:hypothetical protein [Tessaracoccus sp. G1721]